MENGIDSESENNEEDSDEEPDEDEEESDGSCTQALIEHVESSFLDLLESTIEKIEEKQDLNEQKIQVQIPSTVKVLAVTESRDEETQTDGLCVLVSLGSRNPNGIQSILISSYLYLVAETLLFIVSC